MKTIKPITAAVLSIAAASAFAGTDDGNVPAYPTVRASRQEPRPVPIAGSESGQAAGGDSKQQDDFLRQLKANSNGNN